MGVISKISHVDFFSSKDLTIVSKFVGYHIPCLKRSGFQRGLLDI